MRAESLIIGAGPAGLSAAAALARAGQRVALVDRNPAPGGNTADWCCLATETCQRCGLCLLSDVEREVEQAATVQRIAANVTAVEGQSGAFRARLEPVAGDAADVVEAEAVVLATGFAPFDPRQGRPLGYGELDGVVTTVDVNRALRDDDLSGLKIRGEGARRIAFLQCIGSRDPAANRPYCSQVCCQGALRAARALLHRHADWKITVFYIDLQLYGKTTRSRFSELAPRLRLVQGVPAEVVDAGDEGLQLAFQGDDGNMALECFDGVVLSVGMVPSAGSAALAEGLGLSATVGGFLDPASAPKGVFVAGTCAGPSFIEASLLAGRRAAAQLLGDRGPSASRRAAVLGRGNEGANAARALAAAGVSTTLVQLGQETAPHAGDVTTVAAERVSAVTGQLGDFVVHLEGGDQPTVEAAALVLAPGLELVATPRRDLQGLPHQSVAALTAELDAGQAAQRIALLLDPAGPAWRPAAAAALDAATRAVAEAQAEVTVLHEHVALPGIHGQQRYDDAREAGVRFLRQTRPPRAADGDEPVLRVTDAATPQAAVRLPTDRLVVTEHPGDDATLVDLTQRCQVGRDREGLAQRGGVRMFPLRTERPGIWVLGNARQEAGAAAVEAEAAVAAAEVRALLADEERFSREPPAQIDRAHCVHCLTCVRVCPHGAVIARSDQTPLMSATACEQCGACVSACPGEAITLTPEPVATPPKSRTVLFACRRSGVPALAGSELPADTAVVELACGGAIDELDMLRAFAAGAKQVRLLSCHPGSCGHVDNHRLCTNRGRLLTATARRVGLLEGAFAHWNVAPAEGARVARLLAEAGKNGGTP